MIKIGVKIWVNCYQNFKQWLGKLILTWKDENHHLGKILTWFDCQSTQSKIGQQEHFSNFEFKHGKLDKLPSNWDKFQRFKHFHNPMIKNIIFVKNEILAQKSR